MAAGWQSMVLQLWATSSACMGGGWDDKHLVGTFAQAKSTANWKSNSKNDLTAEVGKSWQTHTHGCKEYDGRSANTLSVWGFDIQLHARMHHELAAHPNNKRMLQTVAHACAH